MNRFQQTFIISRWAHRYRGRIHFFIKGNTVLSVILFCNMSILALVLTEVKQIYVCTLEKNEL